MHTIFTLVHIFDCLFVEIYNPAYLETHYVDQSGLRITEACRCLPSTGVKGATTPA